MFFRKFKNRRNKRLVSNEKGVALMIVLAAISLLTAVTTEFAYSTNVNYNLALNEKERMKAYFLAESSLELMKLELKLEKELRSQVSSSPVAQAISGNLTGALCEQFPLSTGLIRAMFLGQTPDGGAEGEEGAVTETAAFIGGLQKEAAEEFLAFEGDFEGTCEDESAKFNLNSFYGKKPDEQTVSGVNDYDRTKKLLMTLLSRPHLRALFPEDSERTVREISRNIADWVDSNANINELGGTSTGSEDSLYSGEAVRYNIKNAKYLTLDELFMVAGVEDTWFAPIKQMFTIYGEDKINVCLADDEVVSALIVEYANSRDDIPSVNPNDKEKMSTLIEVIKNGCGGVKPDINAMGKALDAALKGMGTATETEGTTGSSKGFASYITTESRFYKLLGTGVVGDTQVNITAVLDTKNSQAKNWKYLYWRVE